MRFLIFIEANSTATQTLLDLSAELRKLGHKTLHQNPVYVRTDQIEPDVDCVVVSNAQTAASRIAIGVYGFDRKLVVLGKETDVVALAKAMTGEHHAQEEVQAETSSPEGMPGVVAEPLIAKVGQEEVRILPEEAAVIEKTIEAGARRVMAATVSKIRRRRG